MSCSDETITYSVCDAHKRPDGTRRLLTRGGFFSPSLDGGLPLLLLFNPRRRSNSATRAKSTCRSLTRSAFCAIRCSMCACKAAMVGCSPLTVDVGSGTGDSEDVTDACSLRPRRDLSRDYFTRRPGQLPNTLWITGTTGIDLVASKLDHRHVLV